MSNPRATALKDEITLLRRIVRVQEAAMEAAKTRDWDALDREQREIERLSEVFAGLEAGRARLFAPLAPLAPLDAGDGGRGPSFYALIAGLPGEERLELGRLYRELKLETLRVKAEGERFTAYLEEMRGVTAAFLGAAFPSRGAKLYTRTGAARGADMRSLVINRQV